MNSNPAQVASVCSDAFVSALRLRLSGQLLLSAKPHLEGREQAVVGNRRPVLELKRPMASWEYLRVGGDFWVVVVMEVARRLGVVRGSCFCR